MATRQPYEFTFAALCEGLDGFVLVSEGQLAEALGLLLRTTHNLAEGAAGLAGLLKLARLRGKTVAIVLSGSNIDRATLEKVLHGDMRLRDLAKNAKCARGVAPVVNHSGEGRYRRFPG